MIKGGLRVAYLYLKGYEMKHYTHATIKTDIYRDNAPNILAGTPVQVSYRFREFNLLYNKLEAVYTVTLPDGEKVGMYESTLTNFQEVAQ